MKHCGTQELETGRLLLRRLTMDDSEMMFNNWASDPEVTRYLRWNAHRSWAETAEILNEWEKHYVEPTFYQWGVENKRSGVLMGTISLFPAPELKTGWHLNTEILGSAWEAGYALGRKWWNNGYMTEALCAVRDYWFNTVDAPWLAAIHANENVASSAVLQKAGFVYDHDVIDHKFDGHGGALPRLPPGKRGSMSENTIDLDFGTTAQKQQDGEKLPSCCWRWTGQVRYGPQSGRAAGAG